MVGLVLESVNSSVVGLESRRNRKLQFPKAEIMGA